MKIIDGSRIIEITDDDPVVSRIRALLYSQPMDADPLKLVWDRASGPLREVLVEIAKHGDISQVTLEEVLGVTGIGLRGRTAALARISKAVGAVYPIQKTGGRREHRRFYIEQGPAQEILKLAGVDPSNTP